MLSQFSAKGGQGYSELAGCSRPISIVTLEGPQNYFAFRVLQPLGVVRRLVYLGQLFALSSCRAWRIIEGTARFTGSVYRRLDANVLELDGFPARESKSSFHDVSQFPDVSWPRMRV